MNKTSLLRRALVCLCLAILICSVSPNAAYAQLPEPVARALRQANIPESGLTMWVAPAQGGEATISHNADTPYDPASVMKLITTFSAIDTLGPTYAWKTNVYAQGTLSNGVLNGNLILQGGGDPALTWDKFGQLLREVRSRGVQTIQGDLIIDRSLYSTVAQAAADDFDDQPLRAYNATPEAMTVNFKAISFRLTPVEAGTIDAVSTTPFSPLTIDNQLRATAGVCGNWRANIGSKITMTKAGLRLSLSGSMPASCGEKMLNLTFQDGPDSTAGIFRALWEEMGGQWKGSVREAVTPPDLKDTQLIATWQSPPLSDVIRDVNRFSNNIMAREIFLTLGYENSHLPASTTQSEQFVQSWLKARNLKIPGLIIENGSGLSRMARLTSSGLGQMLQYAWGTPRMPQFVGSLPIAGMDGTAKRRFKNQPVAGHAYFKTGSLTGVMATAGYVLDAQGQWQVLVMIVNDPRAGAAEQAMIQGANWVYKH